MARGLNKVMIIGNLGKDPETQYMPSGVGVTKFSLAATETWKDKQTGELQEHTEWMNVEVWGKAADACAEYLRKGSKVYVEGSLRTDKWTDKNDIERWTTKIRCSNVMFLDGKQGGGDRINAPSDSKDQDGMPPHSRSQQEDFDDDIPF